MRQAGIRTKVTLAFAGVLVLVLPIVTLTVLYAVEFFDAGGRVEHLSDAGDSVAEVRREAHALFAAASPWSEAELAFEERQRWALVDRIKGVAEHYPGLARHLEAVSGAIDLAVGQHRDRVEALLATPPPPHAWVQALDIFEAAIEADYVAYHARPGPPTTFEVAARAQQLEEQLRKLTDHLRNQAWLAEVLATADERAQRVRLQTLRAQEVTAVGDALLALDQRLVSDQRAAGQRIRDSVDRADRFLITLVLLTLVYVAVTIVVLPRRLVQPLRHITSVMRRAGEGRLGVRPRLGGDDEVGRVAAALDAMLGQLERFDDLKRDRIYRDRQLVRRLLELVPCPVCVVDPQLRLEHANDACKTQLSLPEPYEDTSLMARLGGPDAADLQRTLDDALRRGRRVRGLELELDTPSGESSRIRLSAYPSQCRDGTTSHLMLTWETR